MQLTAPQRVTLRLLDTGWVPQRDVFGPSLKILLRHGLVENVQYRVRLTEKGVFVRDRLPPEPRPEHHDPEWCRIHWEIEETSVPIVTADEALANGWPEGPWPWGESVGEAKARNASLTEPGKIPGQACGG